MLPAWSLRSTRALGPVRVGVRDGRSEVVTPDGELLYRTPLPVEAADRWTHSLGGRVVPGPLPAIARIRAYGTAFQLKVWQACCLIPAGHKRTYGQLAEAVGCRSALAVGTALGANPLAGIIPCHRVVAADGLGGFAWGADLKQAWLQAEADGSAR